MPFHSEKQQIFQTIQDEINRLERISQDYHKDGLFDDCILYKDKAYSCKELFELLKKKFS